MTDSKSSPRRQAPALFDLTGRRALVTGISGGLAMKVVQTRLGIARLTHCMRWLELSKRCVEIAQDYAENRHGLGARLVDGPDEVHKMVPRRHLAKQARDFWSWAVAEEEGHAV